jgi:hypothetical protein
MLPATRISRWVLERAGNPPSDRTASLADGAAAPLPATVASVHERAVNVRLDSGDLLCVAATELPLAPNGVAVEMDPAARFGDFGIRAGQRAWLAPEALQVTGAGLDVCFTGARRWEPRPRLGRVCPGDLARRTSEARSIAIAEAPAASLMPLLWAGDRHAAPGEPARSAAGPAVAVRRAATAGDAAGVGAAARELAGLGPGLTPSGDDFLAGFAAAWALVPAALRLTRGAGHGLCTALVPAWPTPSAVVARPWSGPETRSDDRSSPGAQPEDPAGPPRRPRERVRFRDASGWILTSLGEAGTAGASELGRAWLTNAVRGEVAEPLGRFFSALSERSWTLAAVECSGAGRRARSELAGSVRTVLAIGATSGADWLTGALIGVASILDALGEGLSEKRSPSAIEAFSEDRAPWS